ncbi:2-iminoacetate synthase ThiH [Clostridium tagluense]|uniref:2-iminoacetate synthase ThiH n=1 Tax=Clostridium tagluense TaxID=360422 RepID=UPI001C0C6CE5|nr:2-iminoacetate synthase ThiH [Clostridium tagluense]MBU3130523.1 2-iminoacetate synthase ThiH [Clostridium tagluense]
MSFYDCYTEHKDIDFEDFFKQIKDEDILNILNNDKISKQDFLALLSPTAEKHMEKIAQKAHELSLQHFGKTILLFTPLYISNYCVNKCAYCSYNVENKIKRKTLTMKEIEQEANAIASSGLKHILVLTGESSTEAPVSYIVDAVKILKKYFDSISIEIYPLTTEEYMKVVEAGVDGLTVFQETYDECIYDKVHIKGPKKDYKFRLDAPERGCKAKIRSINIGALLGLADWRKESFFAALHAEYLQNKYAEMEVSISTPRIRPHVGSFNDLCFVEDKNLLQIILAFRIFLPRVGITLSTRETQSFRDNLIPLGITKMSAGVSTEVGGHTSSSSSGESQFEISDDRTVEEVKKAILAKNYQPIFKDWMAL